MNPSPQLAVETLTHGAPEYFERIRRRAAERWDQLEADPELAGPWHQLFKQVQSPRHILSELLQNADDAGATHAQVRIDAGRFIFEHDGEDFVEAHFASICRFGYSNKRALHTIGFRGIGFKSTFSLGDRVELYTPTLAVAFEKRRFTEPHWVSRTLRPDGLTRVEVAIANERLEREVRKNLDEWLESPTSLLFFKNIRQLSIGDKSVRWESLGPGPAPDSEWMALNGEADPAFLLVRSGAEDFPEEALAEIRQERMLDAEEGSDFPPCRVEIVLGAAGRLFVVLPTGVETSLPFACNAPFIQDPARMKIKDPETSPTNRWLLQRIGVLAADTMLAWLGQATSVADRARSYALMPDVDRKANSLEGASATVVELAFEAAVRGRDLLLTDDGALVGAKNALSVPHQIFDIWPSERAMALIDKSARPALSRHIARSDRAKLLSWELVDEFTKEHFLGVLRATNPPKPDSWRQLLHLWAYISTDVTNYYAVKPKALRIVPVQGRDDLHAAADVVRLGEKKLLQSDDDWAFLADHLLALNQNWPRFLADQRREGEAAKSDASVDAALAVLKAIGLADTSDVNTVLERVAADYFSGAKPKLADCVRIAQIAARLGVTAGDSFRFVTRDAYLRRIEHPVLFDEDGSLEDLLPEAMRAKHLLHGDYTAAFTSCSREEWTRWVNSGRSGLQTFIPFAARNTREYSRSRMLELARDRGLKSEPYYGYVTHDFVVEDWDFDASAWRYWEDLSTGDASVWARVADRILAQRDGFWARCSSVRISQVATTGSTKLITSEPLIPAWAKKLRAKACLPDTRGVLHPPEDLLRRTPSTEALMDVEPFVAGLLDRETTRPLLDLLGVRSTPTGPARLLDRLRALAKAGRAPAHEVEKWYRRLDQLMDGCSTLDALAIKSAFRQEKLILAHDGGWASTDGVFLSADEDDVPGAALIRPGVGDLSLWRRIGVPERPSADLALKWLANLPSGASLAPDDARRVRSLLARYPLRIWEECGHWLNLSGAWVRTEELAYSVSMRSLVRYTHLHEWVRAKTADLQNLTTDFLQESPFSGLPALSESLREELQQPDSAHLSGPPRPWLLAFGHQLRRIAGGAPDDLDRLRALADALVQTRWISCGRLEVVPYLEGVPAGTPRQADVLWIDRALYVGPLSTAKLAKRVPEELARGFGADVRTALAYAFERSLEDIRAYLEENFELGPETPAPPQAPTDAPNSSGGRTDVPIDLASVAPDNSLNDEVAEEGTEEGVPETVEADAGAGSHDPEQADHESAQPQAPKPPRPRPQTPDLIALFASTLGFKPQGEDRYVHPKGGSLVKTSASKFPWERRSARGEVERLYLVRDHCLEREPMQIEADVWALLEQRPDTYAFILTNPEGAPSEVTGARLRALREAGDIKLHPATYRLVYDRD